MNKVIITGATGFIGFHVLKELYYKNIDIIAIIKPNSSNLFKLKEYRVKVIECSLENINDILEVIDEDNIDTLYHFAWQGISDDDLRNEEIQMNNIIATLKLIDIAQRLKIKTFIGAGSIHENEVCKEMSENSIVDNMGNMYKTAKLAAHYMGKTKAGNYGIRFFWPIITNTYGAGEKSKRLINSIIRKVLRGEIPDLSEGNQLYDFVHVNDVAKAFRLIGENGINGNNYVIGSGEPKPLRKYLEIVEDITNQYCKGDKIKFAFGKVKKNIVYLSKENFNIDNLINEVGYRPEISFEQGIKETVEWIQDDMNQK